MLKHPSISEYTNFLKEDLCENLMSADNQQERREMRVNQRPTYSLRLRDLIPIEGFLKYNFRLHYNPETDGRDYRLYLVNVISRSLLLRGNSCNRNTLHQGRFGKFT